MVQREENNVIWVYDFHSNWLELNLQGLGKDVICNIQQTNGPLVGKLFIDRTFMNEHDNVFGSTSK
jgi:hypothetical protein